MCGGCGCGRFCRECVPPRLCSATSGCSRVRSSMRGLNLRLRIALESLHDCCHLVLPHAQIRAGLRRDAAKRIVYNGCLNVVWGLCWRGSRSMKPCVFQCKVAAVGDERYVLCAAVAAAVVESAVADRTGMAA